MYLSVTINEIRYYAYGHLGYLYDTYKFNRAETYNPDDMFQLKTHLSGVSLKLFQNNKAIYADYLTYMLGFALCRKK